jgi:hypothetical protein
LETTESEGLTLMAGWNANFLEPMNVAKDSGRLGSAPKLSRLHSWKRATHRCLAPRRTARPGWHGPARGGPAGWPSRSRIVSMVAFLSTAGRSGWRVGRSMAGGSLFRGGRLRPGLATSLTRVAGAGGRYRAVAGGCPADHGHGMPWRGLCG